MSHGHIGESLLNLLAIFCSNCIFIFRIWYCTSCTAFSTSPLLCDSPTGEFSRITTPPGLLSPSSFLVSLTLFIISMTSFQSSFLTSFCNEIMAGSWSAFIIILGQPTDVITLFMRYTTLFMYGPLRVTGNAQTPPEILAFMTSIGCASSSLVGLDVMYM